MEFCCCYCLLLGYACLQISIWAILRCPSCNINSYTAWERLLPPGRLKIVTIIMCSFQTVRTVSVIRILFNGYVLTSAKKLSENDWQFLCGEKWHSYWMHLKSYNLTFDSLMCSKKKKERGKKREKKNSFYVMKIKCLVQVSNIGRIIL